MSYKVDYTKPGIMEHCHYSRFEFCREGNVDSMCKMKCCTNVHEAVL